MEKMNNSIKNNIGKKKEAKFIVFIICVKREERKTQ